MGATGSGRRDGRRPRARAPGPPCPCRVASATRSLMPPMMPCRRKHTSSTNTRPEHQLPGRAELQRGLQEVLQEQPDARADERAEQRAASADGGLHDQLARGVEHEGVRRHEALQHAQQAAGEAGVGGRDHEGGELVGLHVVADRRRAQRVLADRGEDGADRRAHDAQRDHDADEIAEREKRIERPAGGELQRREAEVEAGRGHAGQAVLAAGPLPTAD